MAEPLTLARLAEIEARASAATPGPWPLGLTMFRKRGEARAAQHQADEEFVLAARQDVPDLVAEVRRLREALADACELAEEGWSYAGEYFRDKWDYAERIAAARVGLGTPAAEKAHEVNRG